MARLKIWYVARGMLGELGRRLLGACTALVLGTREVADPTVRELQRRVQGLEDALDAERRERKLLAADVESQLDQATRRYSAARAAESRANGKAKENGSGGAMTADELLRRDPAAFDRWVLSGRPPLGG